MAAVSAILSVCVLRGHMSLQKLLLYAVLARLKAWMAYSSVKPSFNKQGSVCRSPVYMDMHCISIRSLKGILMCSDIYEAYRLKK